MKNKIPFSQLVDQIAAESGASKKLVHALLKETVMASRSELEKEGRIHLSGLGTFELHWTESRQGRNPQTGEAIEIPAHNRTSFKPDASVRRFINRDYEHLKAVFLEEESAEVDSSDFGATLDKAFKEPEPQPEIVHEPEPAAAATIPEKETEKEKKKPVWLWILLLLLVVVLIFIFWPASEEAPPPQPVAEEKKTEIIPAEAEPVKAEPKPEPVTQKPPAGIPGGKHTVESGDNLYTIAEDFYKDAYLWPNIYRTNMESIKNPDALAKGISLDIPGLEGKKENLTKNDLNDIAEGYMQVYLAKNKSGEKNDYYFLWVAMQLSPDVFDQFKDKISEADITAARQLKGSVQIQ